MVRDIELTPPNLVKLGVKRKTLPPKADLATIWQTPYPVISEFINFCNDIHIKPFAGGTWKEQGPTHSVGYVTSGYRTTGNPNSPHKFGFAIDVVIGNIEKQINASYTALDYFTRIGFYPDKGILHLDLASIAWMTRYGGRRYWVCVNDKYTSFESIGAARAFAQGVSDG